MKLIAIVGAIILLLACATAGVQAQQRPGLCVTLQDVRPGQPLECDVVVNGAPVGGWGAEEGQFLDYDEPPEFIVVIDPEETTVLDQDVKVTFSAEDGAVASWTEASEEGNAGVVGDDDNPPLDLLSELHCNKEGTSSFSVTIEMESFEPIVLRFRKKCLWPVMSVGVTPSEKDILNKNVPQPLFPHMIFTEATKNLTFYFSLGSTQSDKNLTAQSFTLKMEVEDPSRLEFSTPDDEDFDEIALMQVESEIHVVFKCYNNEEEGPVDIKVEGSVFFFWDETLDFEFTYRCGVSTPLTGLSLGSVAGESDIAADGVLTPGWAAWRHFPTHYDYDLPLFLQLNRTGEKVVVPYTLKYFLSNSSIFTLRLDAESTGEISSEEAAPTTFPFSVQCANAGASRVLAQIELAGYVPVQLRFLYTCTVPKLNLGDGRERANIVALDQDQLWVGNVGSNSNELQLWVQLDSKSSWKHHPYSLQVTRWDPSVLNLTQKDPNNEIASQDLEELQPITLTLDCGHCASGRTNVQMEFGWRWNDTIAFHILKDCVAAPECNPSSDDDDGGMSPAGVFFLVVFLLGLAAYIGFCVYNFMKLGKTGLAIFPGVGPLVAYVQRVCGGQARNEFTPQTDYSAPQGYGAYSSYQEENL